METTADDVADRLVGRLLDDRYALDRLIARGGMAAVYLATDTRLDRTVAVKVMHRGLAEDPEFVARFSREARASARLSTPDVVAVHDQGTDRATGRAYLVMEHVQGRTLRDLLLERGALSPARAVQVLEPVLRALAAAHAAGLVHRDVKPENVLLADDGRIKVADFGLARAVEASELTATTGVLLGTVAYLAPEQVETGRADARTDVYAAGIVLWELLTGTPPYDGESPLSVAFQHVYGDVPAPSTVVRGIPESLDSLVVRATRRDPAARPVDGGAFLAELRHAAADLPPGLLQDDTPVVHRDGVRATLVVNRPAAGSVPVGPPRRRRRRGPVLALVLALIALLALGGGYYFGAGRYTTAPGVLGSDQAAARAVLARAGFSAAASTRFDEAVRRGRVISQDPGARQRVLKNGTIHLVVSLGPDRRGVPVLAGTERTQAESALRTAGLGIGAEAQVYSPSVGAGQVVGTDPPSGTRLKPGTPVSLSISKGPQAVHVPDLRGQEQGAAAGALRRLGFTVTRTTAYDDKAPAGAVVDQSPAGGTVPLGSTVALTVSRGPRLVTVPDVTGMDVDAAVSQLQGLGLKTTVHAFPGPGKVLQTNPGGGAGVRIGSNVTLYVF